MRAMQNRTTEQAVLHHQSHETRSFLADDVQRMRVLKTRDVIQSVLGTEHALIVELGCGRGDISGHFADRCSVIGVECNAANAAAAVQQYPNMWMLNSAIEQTDPMVCTVVVMCEILEHLADPVTVVMDWLPKAQYSVISHPLDEAADLSGGEHCWSLSLEDHNRWFDLGDHKIQSQEIFRMGLYNMVLTLGKRND